MYFAPGLFLMLPLKFVMIAFVVVTSKLEENQHALTAAAPRQARIIDWAGSWTPTIAPGMY
jgi:hypothetical protein